MNTHSSALPGRPPPPQKKNIKNNNNRGVGERGTACVKFTLRSLNLSPTWLFDDAGKTADNTMRLPSDSRARIRLRVWSWWPLGQGQSSGSGEGKPEQGNGCPDAAIILTTATLTSRHVKVKTLRGQFTPLKAQLCEWFPLVHSSLSPRGKRVPGIKN